MTVAIVTDSAASLPDDLAGELGILRVPMQIEIAGFPYSEDEIELEELVAKLDDGVLTSGPAPGAFLEAIERAQPTGRGEGDGVVVLTVGQHFSSTYLSAVAAASARGSLDGVRVVDTGTAAGAQGLVVLEAALEARRGARIDEVVSRANHVMENVHLVAAVGELRYLTRGGRLPGAAARAAEHLGLHVLFELRGKGVHPMMPALSGDGAIGQIVSHWRKTRVEGAALHVAALHAMRPESAEALLGAVKSETVPETSFVGRFGPVMVAHTGPGVVGLAWWWDVPRAPVH